MISDALQWLHNLSEKATAKTVEIDGVKYATTPLFEPAPAKKPTAATLSLHSLEGLKTLLESTADDALSEDMKYLVHVASATEVAVLSSIFGDNRQRETLAKVEPILAPFKFGAYYDLESFIIALQAQFVTTDEIAKVLKLVGNIKDENVTVSADDGVSQNVTARVGIARLENVPVPNPVTLAPYRTFPEVDQPPSKFVLRLRSGVKDGELPTAALFEADGGAWRVVAMASITKWLREALPETVRIIG